MFAGYSLYKNQEGLLYQPRAFPQYTSPQNNPPMMRTPAEHGMPYEEVRLTTRDGENIVIWVIRQPDTFACKTLLFFHENAGNMGMRLPAMYLYFRALKVNIVMVSYRGYGDSTGKPSEAGLIIDAETVLDYVLSCKDFDSQTIFAMGRSLGGAVTLALAEKRSEDLRGIILENTFTCISDMVDKLFPFLAPFKSVLLRLDWNSIGRVSKLKLPILFVSGSDDEIVPPLQMINLRDSAKFAPIKMALEIQGGKHNDTWLIGGTRYIEQVRHYFDTVLAETISKKAQNSSTIESKKNVTLTQRQQAKPKSSTVIRPLPTKGRIVSSATLEVISSSESEAEEETQPTEEIPEEKTNSTMRDEESKSVKEDDLSKMLYNGQVPIVSKGIVKLMLNCAPKANAEQHAIDVQLMTGIKSLMMMFSGGEEINVCFD